MTALPGSHRVTPDHGPRPAGPPDECFYCKARVGDRHRSDCVCREKLVMLRAVVEIPVAVPDAWSEEDVLRRYNESTWCASNLVDWLTELDRSQDCLCAFSHVEFVGEEVPESMVVKWQQARAYRDVELLRRLLGAALTAMENGERRPNLEQQIAGIVAEHGE